MTALLIAILWLAIYVVLAAALIYGLIYVLSVVGFELPPKVAQLLWLAFALFVLVLIVTLLAGHLPTPPFSVGAFMASLRRVPAVVIGTDGGGDVQRTTAAVD